MSLRFPSYSDQMSHTDSLSRPRPYHALKPSLTNRLLRIRSSQIRGACSGIDGWVWSRYESFSLVQNSSIKEINSPLCFHSTVTVLATPLRSCTRMPNVRMSMAITQKRFTRFIKWRDLLDMSVSGPRTWVLILSICQTGWNRVEAWHSQHDISVRREIGDVSYFY